MVKESIPLRCRATRWLAQKWLQRFWERMLWFSLSGLGYQNWIPSLNGEYRFLSNYLRAHARDDLMVFDVGANEGDFTAMVLDHHKTARVHLFEPNPPTFARLKVRFSDPSQANLDRYGVPVGDSATIRHEVGRIVVNPCALSDEAGSLPLFDKDADGSGLASFYRDAFREDIAVESVEVPMMTLDSYCAEHQIDYIDYMKVDVEGFEKQVFAGARRMLARRAVGVIHFEQGIHSLFNGFSLHEIKAVLAGYDIYRILPTTTVEVVTDKRKYDPHYDFFRYHNLVAIRRAVEMQDMAMAAE